MSQECARCHERKELEHFLTRGARVTKQCDSCRSRQNENWRARQCGPDGDEEARVCGQCRRAKPIADFINKRGRISRLCPDCRGRINAYLRRRYADVDEHARQRECERKRESRLKLLDQKLPEGQKRCRACLNVRPLTEFAVAERKGRTAGESRRCSLCRRRASDALRKRRAEWTVQQRQRILANNKKLRDNRKRGVIEHYGGKCACCGVAELEFLTMDHIEKIGSKKRRERGEWGNRFYLSIIQRNFPPGLRVLCWNCNWSHGCYGYCPHERGAEQLKAATA